MDVILYHLPVASDSPHKKAFAVRDYIMEAFGVPAKVDVQGDYYRIYYNTLHLYKELTEVEVENIHNVCFHFLAGYRKAKEER